MSSANFSFHKSNLVGYDTHFSVCCFLCDTDGNKLDGEIPPEVGSLTNLETLYIEGNNFETTNLDEIICEPRLSLGSPSFQHFYADCGSGSSTGVICSCCTHCCDGSGSDCLEGNIQPDEV